MGRRGNPAVVGLFVLAGIALALGAVLAFGAGLFARHTHKFVAYFSGSVNGLAVGAPVKFRGVPLGQVTDIRLRFGEASVLRIPVFFELDGDRVQNLGVRDGDLGDRAQLAQRVEDGLRAQLQTESFVTGVLYVDLDYQPDTPINYVIGPESPIPEIPTVPTALEQLQELLARVASTAKGIDVAAVIQSFRDAADGVSDLARSPEIPKVIASLDETLSDARGLVANLNRKIDPLARRFDGAGKDLSQTLAALQATLDRLHGIFDPDAPLPVELRRTMGDLGEAARSIRELASYLERNPNAILFGRSGAPR